VPILCSMPFTDAEKQRGVELYQEIGPAAAARELGTTDRTIRRWATAAGVIESVPDAEEKTRAARAASAERVSRVWGDFREQEALAAGALASRLRAEIRTRVERGEAGKDLRDLAVSYGILIDKAELMSGQATSRIEVWAESELDKELKSLVTEMEGVIRERG
jgi:transposase-like protein